MNLDAMIAAALAGGREIMDVYARDFAVAFKEDTSPLTEADERSHDVIERILRGAEPDTPLLSEEGAHAPYEERAAWPGYYLIDPLDGTKEFVKRNGEFTVNVAWVVRDAAERSSDSASKTPTPPAETYSPVAGVVYAPFLRELFVGVVGYEAWRVSGLSVADPDVAAIVAAGAESDIDQTNRLRARADSLPLPREGERRPHTIVASRSHMSPETKAFVAERRRDHPDLTLISAGSSLKFCRVADGSADEYPRFAPTNEWDTAAGDAVARAAGCSVTAWSAEMGAGDTGQLGVGGAPDPPHSERHGEHARRPRSVGSADHHGRPLRYNKRELLNPWFLVRRSSGV